MNTTGHIFLEETIQNCQIFNNVFINSSNNTINCIWLQGYSPSNNATGQQVYNNYVDCGPSNSNTVVGLDVNSQANITIQNNVFVHGWEEVYIDSGSSIAAMDYNVYQDLQTDGLGSNAFSWHGNNTGNFATWKSDCKCDAHSVMNSSVALLFKPSTGQPLTGSPAVGLGVNLTGKGIQALNFDIAGVPRVASGSWVAGAYSIGGLSQPAPPTGLVVINVN